MQDFIQLCDSMFNSIAKPTISYQTDFIVRNSGGVLVTANSAVNVGIYTLQLPQFRDRLKSMVRKYCLCASHFRGKKSSLKKRKTLFHRKVSKQGMQTYQITTTSRKLKINS